MLDRWNLLGAERFRRAVRAADALAADPVKRRPERIALRIDKGCLRPADGLSQERLRARGYRVGDVVFAR